MGLLFRADRDAQLHTIAGEVGGTREAPYAQGLPNGIYPGS